MIDLRKSLSQAVDSHAKVIKSVPPTEEEKKKGGDNGTDRGRK